MTFPMENEAERAEILRVRAAEGGARLILTVETTANGAKQREELGVFAARMKKVPQTGAINGEALAFLRREAALCKALSMGLHSLSAGDVSRVSLTRKLRAKGVDKEIAGEAVRELDEKGYLCESDGALREAEKGLAKLWGNRRILADLKSKGYGDEALAAVRERLKDEDSVARCRRLLEKRHLLPGANLRGGKALGNEAIGDDMPGAADAASDRRAAEKLIAALMRYGYAPDEIRAALRAELDEIE